MANNPERDEWLMAQVATGRADLMEPLVRRYGTLLLTFIRRMVNDVHRSEELFQEVFLAVWAKRRQYKFPMPFKPWLYQIAVNKCRAAFRIKGLGFVRSLPDGFGAMVPAGAMEIAGPEPVRAAIETETAEIVDTVVAALPHKQRLVVVMRIWNGLSYAEIAQVLGVREATVRSNMHDALAAIRVQLERRI